MSNRLFSLMILLLGFIGVIVCVVCIFGIWLVGSRLTQAVENVFIQIDHSLVAIQEKVAVTVQRVRELKIASEEIEQSLKNWAKKEASNRLTSRLGVEEKANKLAHGLQQADHWLELSESSVQLIKQALKLGNSADTKPADQLLEELVSLRIQLSQATNLVVRIRERAAEDNKDKLLQQDLDQAVQVALRVIATIGSIDSHLENIIDKLAESQIKSKNLKTKTLRWIRITMIIITFLILWMAAGQISLCIHGWRGF